MKYCFGIDIGGTTVKMGLFQEDGELLDKWEIKTRTENQGEAILPDIAQAVKAKMAEKKLVKEQIIGLGMGLPAPVTEDGIVQNTANLGWRSVCGSGGLVKRLPAEPEHVQQLWLLC